MDYLIVVDMQNDFIDGPLGTEEARAIVPNVCEYIRKFTGKILYTKDAHYNYWGTQESYNLPIEHCVPGTTGFDINAYVANALADVDEYGESNCIEKDAFGATDLVHYVSDCDSIILIGVCTDICVFSNALLLKAFYPNIPIYVKAECCAGSTPEKHEAALRTMESCQIYII